MLNQIKKVLVETYIGCIALGWLLAQTIMQLVNIFSAPVARWMARNEYRKFAQQVPVPAFSLQDAIPEVIRFVLFLLIWYLLFRWLYYKPFVKTMPETDRERESPV